MTDRDDLRRRRQAKPEPRTLSGRGLVVLLVSFAILLAAWGTVFYLYSNQQVTPDRPAPTDPSGVSALIEPMEFRAIDDKMVANLQLTAGGNLVDASGALKDDTTVTVNTSVSRQAFAFGRGKVMSTQEVTLSVIGEIQDYPNDSYAGSMTVAAQTMSKAPDGTVSVTEVPVALGVVSSIDGWETEISTPAAPQLAAQADITTSRSTFITWFAWAILALIAVLPVLGLAVAWLFITNRRVSYLEYLGWFIGLVLALPFLRRVLPGDPPLGCRIDVTVFFWCLVGAMISMVLAVLAWYLQSRQRLLNSHYSESEDTGGDAVNEPSHDRMKTTNVS